MKRVVMFSGGLGSWATAKRVAERHGTDNLFLVFADVKGNSTSPHSGEDEDTYRFINEAAANVGGTLVTLNEGRDIWQVFKDNRFLGNSRLANCSKFLKQQPCREWLDANCDPADTTVYVGIDWTETHRLAAIVNAYLPYKAEAPMTEAPFMDKADVKAACVEAGIDIPRLYKAGFPHNNCGGGCVRAGQAQFELLLREHPERYRYWEQQEQELREHLDADVSILKDRATGGISGLMADVRRGTTQTAVPLTLRRFRERVEQQPAMFDALDFGGCGCFVDTPTEETA
jgi:hypothetical protein